MQVKNKSKEYDRMGWPTDPKRRLKLLEKVAKEVFQTCEECGVNPADWPSELCSGCRAYRDHTGQF